ncbi:MAG TPA: hypothetical protein VKQ10_04485 [Spirochaetota bacterium]|nr:hypothetical protein [Spirochaetota bacterium]
MKIQILGIMILICSLAACSTAGKKVYNQPTSGILFVVPHGLEQYRETIIKKCQMPLKEKAVKAHQEIKIVIYSYSSGIERFSINKESSHGGIQQTREKGYLSVLVIIKPANEAKYIHFINIQGDNMNDLALKLSKRLCTLIE